MPLCKFIGWRPGNPEGVAGEECVPGGAGLLATRRICPVFEMPLRCSDPGRHEAPLPFSGWVAACPTLVQGAREARCLAPASQDLRPGWAVLSLHSLVR